MVLVLLLLLLPALRRLHRRVDHLVDLVGLCLERLLLAVHDALELFLVRLLDHVVLCVHRLFLGALWLAFEVLMLMLIPMVVVLKVLLLCLSLRIVGSWIGEEWMNYQDRSTFLLCALLVLFSLRTLSYLRWAEIALIWILCSLLVFLDEAASGLKRLLNWVLV